ncbi:glycosyltransferase family 4 protein [Tautonia sociabilis]|uniref:Glycosyltransferase family 1 protein n=1 Tax=Tautonia sociabilis TaxID=2080755 RepID=A0A432MQK3_9BACT|nr:glycosyltransferase family 1 protein [Tautonia sociabilis]RUL89764.1 glycosyltransferase family 1 protein [Tautonia sociabilis]
MRIALFTETFLPKIDGIVTRLTHTITHLRRAGDEVLVVAPAGAPRRFEGARVIGVPAVPFALYPELKLAITGKKIGRRLLKFDPEIVHVVNPAVLGACGVAHAVKRDRPLVASYHTHVPKYLKHYKLGALEGLCWKIIRSMHNKARLNLCTSTAMIDELNARGFHNLALWPRAVDTELFRPGLKSEAMREELSGGRPGAPLLLYVGRLAAEKEIDRIRTVLRAIPEATLALVGDGPAREKLERHFEGTRARFVGYMRGERLASAFASADALVFPSRTETLGLVLLEAMAAGCPVIAARAGGITDIVTDGVNGCLFDPADPAGLTVATRRLLDSASLRESLHRNARIEAERWSWAAATDALRSYYRAVLDGGPVAPTSAGHPGPVSPDPDSFPRPAGLGS